MIETDYVPVKLAPALDKLRADIKQAAKEHPEYGSCPHCIKAVRIDKYGRLRDHSTPELARGNIKATYRCPGSGKPYAEHGEFGSTWDLNTGRWTDLDVDIPVLFVAHDEAAEKGVELPLWQLCEVRPTDAMRRGAKALLDGSKWRIELGFSGRNVTGYLIRADWTGGPAVWEIQVDEAAYGGTERVIGKLVARLDATDYSDRVVARGE